jgi:hypothetical protein
MKTRLALAFLVLSISFHSTVTRAQWPRDGVPVSTSANDQENPTIAPDGAGGAIVTWYDLRSGAAYDIYAQRITAAGAAQWTTDGVAVCTAANGQYYPMIISDGAGGAIIAWQDTRGAAVDIYAQRVTAAGLMQWTANGVAICTATGDQNTQALVSDGAGGAIIVWQDLRNLNDDIFAQRINSAGVVQWTANGVAICTSGGEQTAASIISDASGGAIIGWQDTRFASADVFVQRINASGVVQWNPNGAAVSTVANEQYAVTMATDGASGAIMAWADTRTSPSVDIYAQRVNSLGAMQWTANGVAVSTAAGSQNAPITVTDGAGGAIVTWNDLRGASFDVYAQRISASGNPQWALNGVPLCTQPGAQLSAASISDGAGGAVVAWHDLRSATYDIYAQRVDARGFAQWTNDGMSLSAAAGNQQYPSIAPDNAGGGIVVWLDSRTGIDVYAQRVEFTEGYWGHPEPTVTAVADIPGDQGGKVKLNWKASGWDVRNYDTITHYSIWRAVDAAAFTQAQTLGANVVDDLSKVGADFTGTAYRKDPMTSAAGRYWEFIGTQDALFSTGYSISASTRSDSTLGNTKPTYFQVVAHTSNPYTFWASNELSGRSVDNLAPTAPLFLIAQRTGNYVHLRWNRVHAPDLRNYSVYRKTSAGVTPVPVNFLSNATDTVLTDTTPPASAVYYIVVATDVHANQSPSSNEAALGAATGVGNLPPITELMVLQNQPNPFTVATELSIGLPAPSDVNIDVFDVAGRKVSTIAVKHAAAGWQKMSFSGRDSEGRPLSSGVYFYRVHANGTTLTRKMVITR